MLYRQFGADPAKADDANTVNRFRTECLRELKENQDRVVDLELHNGQGRVGRRPLTPAYSATRYERRFALRERWISRMAAGVLILVGFAIMGWSALGLINPVRFAEGSRGREPLEWA